MKFTTQAVTFALAICVVAAQNPDEKMFETKTEVFCSGVNFGSCPQNAKDFFAETIQNTFNENLGPDRSMSGTIYMGEIFGSTKEGRRMTG
jgi:hypothetical protein